MLRMVSSELPARSLGQRRVGLARAGLEHLVAEAMAGIEHEQVLVGKLVGASRASSSPSACPSGTTTLNGSS